MRPFLLALQFFTVITLRRDLTATDAELAASRAWYGVVGGLLGLMLAACAWLLARWLPPLPLAALLVLLWGLATRFLHLDGLADSADALVHITTRERALEIMKDSRTGSFGLAAVTTVLLVKFAALASLEGPRLLGALIAAPALARVVAAFHAALLPPARSIGLGASIRPQGAGLGRDLLGGLAALALAGVVCGRASVFAALTVGLLGLLLARWYLRRIGGFTGDTCGAAIELCEAAALLVLSAG